MKYDVILSGVGGHGVLSVATVIAQAAVNEGFFVRQSEVHGMAQRGGAVIAHLRISDKEIAGDLVPRGSADLILSMEPLECLRYTAWLGPQGMMVTAAEPFLNIDNYPPLEDVLAAVKGLPNNRIIGAAELAKQTGLARSVNMVMVGAASPFLPVKPESLENAIEKRFTSKGEDLTAANIKAFQLGRQAAAK